MLQPLIEPRVRPPLDPGFKPAVLVNQKFRQAVKGAGVPFVIGLDRPGGEISRIQLEVFADDHPLFEWNFQYVERIVKFLLWQRGGYRLLLSGSPNLTAFLTKTYSAEGERSFDYHFFGASVYEKPFEVISCAADEIPSSVEVGRKLGGNLNGYRIGFDLGATDRKVTAMIDGVVVFSEEVNWEPRQNTDPEYHYREVMSAIQSAAAHLPRVDAIGGSSAGIIINNRPMVGSLFRGIPASQFGRVKDLFTRIRAEIGVPFEVINDGDVTALAGSMAIHDNGILGIAMGSSEAAGYVNTQGHIMGWLNELAFAPIDYSPHANVDEWSGDKGCGASYLSQQCVFRLAPMAGIPANDLHDAAKLIAIQNLLEAGDEGAQKIWQTMGVYLGYGIAHYADYYDIEHVLILGRCTSGRGGDLLLEGVNKVFSAEFPELMQKIMLHLPDERIRRVGQSVAAASLPYFPSD